MGPLWWGWRKVIHEDEFQSSLSTHAFITRYQDELNYRVGGRIHPEGAAHAITIKWSRPTARVLKVNVVGAVAKAQGSGALSVVCRDDQWRFMGSSSIKVNGISGHATMEAMACAEAISLPYDLLHANRILIASNCLSVVKELQSKQSGGLTIWW
jgi:hypothetical protein